MHSCVSGGLGYLLLSGGEAGAGRMAKGKEAGFIPPHEYRVCEGIALAHALIAALDAARTQDNLPELHISGAEGSRAA